MKEQNQYRDFLEEKERYRQRRQQELQRYRYEYTMTEEEREARRSGREEARRLRRRAKHLKKAKRIMPPLLLALVVLIVGTGTVFLFRSLWNHVHKEKPSDAQMEELDAPSSDEDIPEEDEIILPPPQYSFRVTPATINIPDETLSSVYAILIDLDEGTILAQRGAWEIIHPASMTKILTVLVAAEQIRDFDGTAVVSQETIDYCIEHNCSIAGFQAEEEISVMDLFYGTILPSGADAAVTLAEYAAGSHEAFVELMNEKTKELGISGTAHFANCVGLYDEHNVCTAYDMAVILKAAMENDLCRRILGERIHDISPVEELHPEGISLSNWFIRRIEDHMPEGVVVKGAKTGFINQSGNCAASLAQDAGGRACLCVTAMAGSSWQCIFDHVALYTEYGFNALD